MGIFASKEDNLFSAVRDGKIADVNKYLLKGADVNAKDERTLTPLSIAVLRGYRDLVELLIAKGADVNARAGRGETPLLFAAASGDPAMSELLINNGADVTAGSRTLMPLHVAAQLGHKELIELLIAKGADVNALTASGKTPLDYANEKGWKDVAELLRQHGAR